MIEQTAIVVDLESGDELNQHGYVWVETQIKSSCQSCSSQSSCGTSLISKIFNKQSNRVRVLNQGTLNNCSAKVGDRVVIGLSEKNMLYGSLMLYMLPLLSIFVFAILALFIHNILAIKWINSDFMVLIFSVLGFMVSRQLSNYFFSHKQCNDSNEPETISNLHQYQAKLIKTLPNVIAEVSV